jgi:hypothetical protein
MYTTPRVLRRVSRRRPKPPLAAKRKSVWDFLNSSFGVFLMSSVFLGLLSFAYGQWRDVRTRQQKIDQLDIEIALRLQAMDQMCSGPENKRYSNLVNVNAVIGGDPKSSFYVRKPLFQRVSKQKHHDLALATVPARSR